MLKFSICLRWFIFVDMLKNDPNVVAVGPYISCEYNKHIQSFMIALDGRGLGVIEKTWRCPCLNEDRGDWIRDTEVVRFTQFFSNKLYHTLFFNQMLI